MKILKIGAVLTTIVLSAGIAVAESIEVGAQFPPLTIESRGELVLEQDEVSYKAWSSDAMTGKVVYFQYMAARPSADKMNKHVNNALETADIKNDNFISTVIVNVDDVSFGATSFAVREMKKNKKRYPHTHLIADDSSKGRQLLKLEPKSSAVGVLDKTGKVLFFKDGKLTDNETSQVIELIKSSL